MGIIYPINGGIKQGMRMEEGEEQGREIWERISVDKELSIPAYLQIKEYIKEMITEGRLVPHARVPAERELCILCDVSRMTVRQALSELVKEGYLYRKKGRGTFAAPPKIAHPMMSLVSFSEDMYQRGMKAGGRTLKAEEVRFARDSIREALSLKEGETLLLIERIRFADSVPVVLERSYFSYNRFGALRHENLEGESLYLVMERKYGVILQRSRESIEAGMADPYLAEKLSIDKGTPILMVAGTSYDENGDPIEHVHSFYRGDRYKFMIELER